MNSCVRIDRLASHFLDLAHLDEAAVERGIEQAQARGRLASFGDRRGARENQHFVRDLRRGNPDLGAVHDVNIAAAFRRRLQLRGFEAGIRLGHREAGFLLAGGDRRQHAALLLLGAVNDDRIETENIHVNGGSAGQPGARRRDRLHHDRGFGHAEARAAKGLRNADAEPAVGGERAIKLFGKFSVAVALSQ